MKVSFIGLVPNLWRPEKKLPHDCHCEVVILTSLTSFSGKFQQHYLLILNQHVDIKAANTSSCKCTAKLFVNIYMHVNTYALYCCSIMHVHNKVTLIPFQLHPFSILQSLCPHIDHLSVLTTHDEPEMFCIFIIWLFATGKSAIYGNYLQGMMTNWRLLQFSTWPDLPKS